MKKLLFLLGLTLACNLLCAQEIKRVKIADIQRMIDTSTQPLIVNFWASWCTPCIHEIPWFEKNVAAFKDHNVKLLLVSLDLPGDYPGNLRKFINQHHYASQVVWLEDMKADEYCPKIDSTWHGTIPVSLFVNNQTHFRQFLNRQVTDPQVQLLLQQMTK
ncbi:TlpA disulfide reductase family protein [Deminuibacter soli]|nr:TlpA disulfide reductase family protein [Deminuibacter soli]